MVRINVQQQFEKANASFLAWESLVESEFLIDVLAQKYRGRSSEIAEG